jgi:RNA polymerase sigma factor (sigma-70 family)
MSDTNRQFQTLLRQLQEGSEEAARELAATFRDHVLRCIRRTLHRRMRRQYDSLDFEQIVWASVLTEPEKIADIRSPEQFVRFLVGVARNKVAHAGRHMEARKNDVGREVRLDDAGDIAGPHPISRDPTPSAAAIGQERYEQLVDRPLERDRQIVELRSEGNTFEEVAEKLGIDERTARKVISRLKRMQQIAPRPPRSAGSSQSASPSE